MPHYPINHPLSGLYRTLAVVVALLLLVWAGIGLAQTSGQPLFGGDGVSVLGLRAGRGWTVLLGLTGLLVLVSVFLGRGRQHFITEGAGGFLILLGLAGLALPSFFAVGVAGCVAVFLGGSALLLAGMYTKPGTREQAWAEEVYRHQSFGRVAEPAKVISSAEPDNSKVTD